MLFVILPIIGVAIVCIACAWILTYRELRETKTLGPAQTVSLVGALAATAQVPIPFVMAMFFVAPRNPNIGWVASTELLFFLIALPCAIRLRGALRACLIFSSIFFLALTGLIYIVSGIAI